MLGHIASAITAQFITRLLIISYFVAIALGLIGGIDVSRMAAPFLNDSLALLVMSGLVLLLCAMVLVGLWRRPAALVLSLIIFWTSYLTLYAGGEISAFWRDLALIGGLLLTANITTYADRAMAENWDDSYLADADEAAQTDTGQSSSEPDFREDFNVARAS